MATRDDTTAGSVRVRRGRVDSVDLYEIKDGELDLLEKGSPADLQLNFAIFLLSIAFSAICSLATATFARETIKIIFIVVVVVGILLGVYLLISWHRGRRRTKDVCKLIRSRIPPEVAPPAVADEPESEGEDTEKPAG